MLDPSDYVFLVATGLVVLFELIYTLARPRVWWRSPLGWVIALYGLSVLGVLALVDYAIVFEQRMPETPRLAIGLFVALAITAKTVILVTERRRGRRERAGR